MTKLMETNRQRDKSLKIAELEIQRYQQKIGELEMRPTVTTPLPAGHHNPGTGVAPLEATAAEENTDFDIDQVLGTLVDKEEE
jgi:hypothetical protein